MLEMKQFVNREAQMDPKSEEYKTLMHFYSLAIKEMSRKIDIIQYDYLYSYERDYIDHIKSRVKSPESILKKMEEKGYPLTYGSLIDSVNDIAGIRIICPIKDDIFEIKKLIREFPEIKVIKEKDYVSSPKKSGYASLHLVLEIPVYMNQDDYMPVKVEIQIRSLAMDFWASLEHKVKYKASGNVNQEIAKELVQYAKTIDHFDNKMVGWYQ